MDDNPYHLVSVICVLRCQGQYLLVQRSFRDKLFPGLWQNLGGKVEPQETVEDALRREIWEEIGIEVGKRAHFEYLISYSWRKDGELVDRLGLVFMLDLPTQPRNISLSKELCNYSWFELEETVTVPTIDEKWPKGTLDQLMFAYMS